MLRSKRPGPAGSHLRLAGRIILERMLRVLLFCLLTLPAIAADDAACNATLRRVAAAGVAVPLAAEESRSTYPTGAPLGNCALRLGTAGAPGFAIYGTPDTGRRAELRVTAVDRQSDLTRTERGW